MALHAVAAKPDPHQRFRIFTLAQMRRLEAELGATGDRRLRKEIRAAAELYRMFLTVKDMKRPAPRRAKLEALIKPLIEAEAALDQIGLWSRSDLNDELRKMLGNDLSAANVTAGISSVLEAAKRVRRKLPRGDGKPDVNNLRELCEDLAKIYWRHKPQAPHKVVKYWVERVVAIVDPEVTDRNLNTVWRGLKIPPQK